MCAGGQPKSIENVFRAFMIYDFSYPSTAPKLTENPRLRYAVCSPIRSQCCIWRYKCSPSRKSGFGDVPQHMLLLRSAKRGAGESEQSGWWRRHVSETIINDKSNLESLVTCFHLFWSVGAIFRSSHRQTLTSSSSNNRFEWESEESSALRDLIDLRCRLAHVLCVHRRISSLKIPENADSRTLNSMMIPHSPGSGQKVNGHRFRHHKNMENVIKGMAAVAGQAAWVGRRQKVFRITSD